MSTNAAGPTTASGGYIPSHIARPKTLEQVGDAILLLFKIVQNIGRRASAIALTDPTAAAAGILHGSKAGDLDATYIQVVTPATPDEVFEVAHFLGRTPIGYEVVSTYGKPGLFYAVGTQGRAGWGPTTIKLACTTSSCNATLRVY